MKQKKMEERLRKRQRAFDSWGGGSEVKVRARKASGGYHRPGSVKQSG